MEEKEDLIIGSSCSAGKFVEVPKKGYLYIDLEKAKEYYLKGGVHREIALNAGYEEAELKPVRNEWESKFIGKVIDGVYFESDGCIYKTDCICNYSDKSTYKTEKQAKSALAYAQLTQLMALPEYNGDWVPDWSTSAQLKHCIEMDSMNIVSVTFYTAYSKLPFKTIEIRNRFLENNYDLLKEYFELD